MTMKKYSKGHAVSVIVAALAAVLTCNMASAASVDVTSKNGITIGGAIGGAGGKFVPWGGSVELVEKDAFLQSNGHCAFNVTYDMRNQGDGATPVPFKNTLSANGTAVAIVGVVAANGLFPVNAGQSKQVSTQPYLPLGEFVLSLKLDSDNLLAESNKDNNTVSIKAKLTGTCGAKVVVPPPPPPPSPKADLVSPQGILIGGTAAGVGRQFGAWGGSVKVRTADSFLNSNGKCAFNLTYYLSNNGGTAAGSFSNRIYSGTTLIGQQSGLKLNKGISTPVATQVYLSPGANLLRLVVDADNTVPETNETNNTSQVTVNVDATCKPVVTTPTVPATGASTGAVTPKK
jgi:hypothetical protein